MVIIGRGVVTLNTVTLFSMLMFSIVGEKAVSLFGKMLLNFIVFLCVFPEDNLHKRSTHV